MVSDSNVSLLKMSDFVSFPLFGFTLIIKLRLLKYFNIFDKKVMSDLIKSCQIVSDLV